MMWQNLEQNEDLSTLWKSVWTELKTSLVRRGHPWRTPCLCTQSADGPQGRTVVLRRVLPSLGAVRFHTDGRSSKIDDFNLDPRVSFVFYHPRHQKQVRLKGSLQELDEGERLKEWNQTSPRSREIYGLLTAPRTPQNSSKEGWNFSHEDLFLHFRAYQINVSSMDILTLKPEGHQRALFIRSSNHTEEIPIDSLKNWKGTWTTP